MEYWTMEMKKKINSIRKIIISILAAILLSVIVYTSMYHKIAHTINKVPNKGNYDNIHIRKEIKRPIISHVTLTCYNPVQGQTDSEPLTTADGSKINLRKLRNKEISWCAISRDLLYLFPKNKPKVIYIEGYGEYLVKDVMNKRFNHRVDILIHPKESILVKKDNVKIKIYQ